MTSRYSVIQYVPNPIADERINIGVLVFDEQAVRVHFLQSWDRVRCFGLSEDIDVLKNFAVEMDEVTKEGLLFPGDRPTNIPAHERLVKVARGWRNGIQFTEPRGSLAGVDQVLDELARTYLLEPPEKRQKLRDRQAAAKIATSSVRDVFITKFGKAKAKQFVKAGVSLKGSHKEHQFDVAVANGRPYLAAHGISFEVHTPESIQDAIAWMIMEVKQVEPTLPLVIITLPPTQNTPDYMALLASHGRMTATYKDLGAIVIDEAKVESWLHEQLDTLKI
jgi:Protein of unknown function (DUF3037)